MEKVSAGNATLAEVEPQQIVRALETSADLELIQDADARLTQRFADVLTKNSDLKRSLVSFQANKTETEHRWFKYKEGFSASLIRYILDKFNINEGTLLDPFAGSGTSLFVASERGMDAVGIELLPSSAEIVSVRALTLDRDRQHLAERLRKFKAKKSWEDEGKTIEFPHLRITNGAFPKQTEFLLSRYLYDCSRTKDETLRRLLRLAALSVLEVVSFTRKDGQYLRWDTRSGRTVGKKPFDKGKILDFTEAITKKLDEIASDLCGEDSLFPVDQGTSGKIQLEVGSCLEIIQTLETAQFDVLVTSPPYCNRYDYTRTYALELALLGTGEDELSRLRQKMLSCTVENREKHDLAGKFDAKVVEKASIAFKKQEVLTLILSYLERCRINKTINNPGIPRMVRNYFWESALLIFESFRVLKPGAKFIMVNDNVRYQGAHVPVDLILSDFALAAGFHVDAIWVLPVGKGNSSQQMGAHGREEVRKCVYVWSKPNKRPGYRVTSHSARSAN